MLLTFSEITILSTTFHNNKDTKANSIELVNVFVPYTIITYELERSNKYLFGLSLSILHILKNRLSTDYFYYIK